MEDVRVELADRPAQAVHVREVLEPLHDDSQPRPRRTREEARAGREEELPVVESVGRGRGPVEEASGEEKERWGDKTPLYLRYVEEIDEIWPDARFAVVVRDGRDVALSVMRVPFGANNVWAAARAWAQGIRLGLEAERRYPERVVTVRYEDLVAQPAKEAARVCGFLGLEFRAEMLEIERTDPDKILKEQAGWFTNVWAGINTSAVGKWKRKMTPAQQQLFARVAGPELEAMGYEAGEPAPVAGLRTAAYAGHDAAMRGVNFV